MRVPVIALAALLIFCSAGPLAAATDSPSIKIAPDESQPTAKLVEAGMPAPDREWASDDYRRVTAVLREIVRDNPRKLPRFDSTNSGAVMQRLVNPENFAMLRDRKFPLGVRLAEMVALSQTSGELAMVYVEALGKGESFDRELVELMAFMATVSLEAWTLVDELLATLTPEEREGRASALRMIRSGSARIVQGALETFTEVNTYRPAELTRFATLLTPVLPALIPRLTADSATEARVRLRALTSETSDPSVAAALKKLHDAVEAATPAPAQ